MSGQGCCLTGARQLRVPKKILWAPKCFAAAPNTSHVAPNFLAFGLVGSLKLFLGNGLAGHWTWGMPWGGGGGGEYTCMATFETNP